MPAIWCNLPYSSQEVCFADQCLIIDESCCQDVTIYTALALLPEVGSIKLYTCPTNPYDIINQRLWYEKQFCLKIVPDWQLKTIINQPIFDFRRYVESTKCIAMIVNFWVNHSISVVAVKLFAVWVYLNQYNWLKMEVSSRSNWVYYNRLFQTDICLRRL